MLKSGAWAGAVLAAERPAERDRLAARLLADAEAAADQFRWHRVRLRLAQLEKLGAGSGAKAAALAQRMGKVAEKEKPFANGEGMDLIWCPPGEFTMGESDQPGPFLKHRVILTQGFWLAKTEVTQAQYEAVMGVNPSTNVSSGPTAPAENFSWHEAMEFCRKLTDRERARGAVPAGWEYALPAEAQWEYACRAGATTGWSFGDEESQLHKYGNSNDRSANFTAADASQDDGHQFTAPVGSYPPNAWGFHDMHGNVYEWCRDAIDPNKWDYPAGPVTDPLVTRGPDRVYRGGSFGDSAAECRSAFRGAARPASRRYDLGLRPALVPSGLPVQYSP